jgi:hypothetical protein
MESSKNRNWSIRQWFVIPVLSLALLLLLGFEVSAQTITARPNSVGDPAKPESVVLSFTKADGTTDTAIASQVDKVTVGGQQVLFKPDAQQGTITITPPANLSGPQTVELRDKDDKVLGPQLKLTYPSASSPSPTSDGAEARRDKLASYNWFYLIVTVMFIFLLVPFGWTIVRAVKFSRATYRSPLGLPVGSFRAILAYTLVAYVGFYILASILSVSYFTPPDFLLGIVATVIGFYFGSRTDEGANADQRKGSVRGTVRQGTNPARGAIVKFKRDDGTEPYSRITDVDGRFELSGAKPGKYKVTAALTGSVSSEEQDVAISEGSDHEIAIVIQSGAAPPAQRGSVQGTVTKPDNSAAPQATVVMSQGGVEKGKATTDANGKYKIENVAFGDYEIVASLEGNSPSDTAKVKVTAVAAQTIDLKVK